MANSNLEVILQELKAFRSQLFKIDLDEESSKQELQEILNKYLTNRFEPFAEEYLIAGLDIEIVGSTAYSLKLQINFLSHFILFYFIVKRCH